MANITGLIVGRQLAINAGLPPDRANFMGVIGALGPPRPLTIVIVDQLVKREAEELAQQQTSPQQGPILVSVPDVIGDSPATARQKLEGVGLVPDFKNEQQGTAAKSQQPNAGTQTESGSKVYVVFS